MNLITWFSIAIAIILPVGMYISEQRKNSTDENSCIEKNVNTTAKKPLIRVLLLLGYCIPFVFLAMNEDAITGTLWFYLVMILGFGALCYASVKTKNSQLVIAGNILSFVSSCVFAWFFRTEKWEYYFKPFLPNQLIVFETVIVFVIQIIFIMNYNKKIKE